jgi:UDP-N-acetyl-D-galactosamine dehydrogenase
MIKTEDARIAMIGLGYVGLPLAVAFAHHYPVVGFDINARRVRELQGGVDSTLEVGREELADLPNLSYSDDPQAIADCNVYIITVPTPIDNHRRPDLRPLVSASETVGRLLGSGDVVIYESTVYPGATEEICVPLLERHSGLRYNRDFVVGYSPERINPGDRLHQVTRVVKVTSGSTPEAAEFVDRLYRKVITAGTHLASSIAVAEAAKVIENTQRDVNIALVNELALLFSRLGIDTEEVLEAAGTKWNFLPFRPGLVGGHCIGVDPYYLTHKAQAVGYHPEMILAGRRINDNMGFYVAGELVKLMIQRKVPIAGSRILVMGLTFKEDCSDLRNTRVIDIINELASYTAEVELHDPWVNGEEAEAEYGVVLVDELQQGRYDAVVIAVAHSRFAELGVERIRALCRGEPIVYDVKYLFPASETTARL